MRMYACRIVRLTRTTPHTQVRTVGSHARYLLFAACAYGVWQKQKYYRASIADEDVKTHDRISRTSYVRLGDGRLAQVCQEYPHARPNDPTQVYPVVHTDTSPCGLVRAVIDTFNPLP